MANGVGCLTDGAMNSVLVSFAGIVVYPDFLVANRSLFNVIVGSPSQEELRVVLDQGEQKPVL